MKKKVTAPFSFEPRQIETFMQPASYEMDAFARFNAPSCFNGIVRVRRYRITAELIQESDDVIFERIRAMWQAGENHHSMAPLNWAAAQIGRTLDSREWGKAKRQTATSG